MPRSPLTRRSAFILLGLALLSSCGRPQGVEDDATQPAPTRSEKPARADEAAGTLTAADVERYQKVFEPFKHFEGVLQLMGESSSDEPLARMIEELRARPKVVEEAVALYTALTGAAREDARAFGEARWRTVHLIGLLRLPEAGAPLSRIAMEPLPDPAKAGEAAYAAEFRIRARAIDGLERLGDVDTVRRIYDQGGALRGVAAAALFELGKAPAGVERLNSLEAFGAADPADFKRSGPPTDPEQRIKPPSLPAQESADPVVPETNRKESANE